jgi:hypothetical protein
MLKYDFFIIMVFFFLNIESTSIVVVVVMVVGSAGFEPAASSAQGWHHTKLDNDPSEKYL